MWHGECKEHPEVSFFRVFGSKGKYGGGAVGGCARKTFPSKQSNSFSYSWSSFSSLSAKIQAWGGDRPHIFKIHQDFFYKHVTSIWVTAGIKSIRQGGARGGAPGRGAGAGRHCTAGRLGRRVALWVRTLYLWLEGHWLKSRDQLSGVMSLSGLWSRPLSLNAPGTLDKWLTLISQPN